MFSCKGNVANVYMDEDQFCDSETWHWPAEQVSIFAFSGPPMDMCYALGKDGEDDRGKQAHSVKVDVF